HAFRRPADAEINVDAGLIRAGGVDDAGDVAVADEADRGAGSADFLDHARVTWAIENAGRHLVDRHALGGSQGTEIVGDAEVEIDEALGIAGADSDLLHVD